jgi:two-component SAPR family response regulator
VRCFGKFRVDQGDGTPVKWRTNKTEELFAFLVDRGGAETRKETIIDLLWEHMDEKRASDNFSTCLYNLKKTLAGLGFPRILMYNGGTLRVDMNQISTDVQEFERWAAAPDRPDASSLQAFREMVARFGEGYMAENYFAWAESRRRQLDEIFVKRIVRAAAREAENGKKAEAAELLKLGLRKDPLDQDLNMALLELYAQMQDKVAAVKHYEAYKKRLDEEYGIEPDGNMRKLVERLLQA